MSDNAIAVVVLLAVLGFLIAIIWLALRQHYKQAAREYLCLGCETVSSNNFAKRPFWPWFIVGPFALLWPKKMTCRTCNSHELVPADSPRARKVVGAAAGK